MSFANSAETDILNKLFLGTEIPWNGNANLFLALHTADPGEVGSLAAEATYTSYARIAVARTVGGWTVSGDTVSNTTLVQFPQCTGGSNVITHVSICTAITGGSIVISGALNSSLTVSNLIQPQFAIGAISFILD